MEESKGGDSDMGSFEDSQEDEFEVEDVVQRPDSDDEDGGEWSDCDNSDEDANKKKKISKMEKLAAAAMKQNEMDVDSEEEEEQQMVNQDPAE